MAQRYQLTLPEPALARGPEPALGFNAHGPDEFAAQLQQALREDALFQRWRAAQEDPDGVDEALGVTDPDARVSGSQRDLGIELVVVTSLSGNVLRHRMGLLAGRHWALHDVSAA